MKDLIVLVADKNMEFAVKGILQRTTSLKIREISYDVKDTAIEILEYIILHMIF